MKIEIRPAKSDEIVQFEDAVKTAFVPTDNELTAMSIPSEWTLCAFQNGKLLSTYGAWPMTVRFNGNSLPVAGITQVSTLPMYRRQGCLRKITERHFNILYEQGDRPIAVLLASRAAIYQRFGYAIISTSNSYRIEPRYIQFSTPIETKGQFYDTNNNYELVRELYRTFIAERNGYLHRSRIAWKASILSVPPQDSILKTVIYQENGQDTGYIIYTVTRLENSKLTIPLHQLVIRDYIWLNPEAYSAGWNYLSNMDLVDNIIWSKVPSDDPLPHLLLEPRTLNCVSRDGLLGRIIDVQKALVLRPYEEESSLIFEVIDHMCPWNNRKWMLETSVFGSQIHQTSQAPALRIPISTLAMILFGQISTSEAARMGRLELLDHRYLSTWDKVMRTKYKPFCPDIF